MNWYNNHCFLAQPCLISLLGPLTDQTTSLHSLLLSLETQAQILLDKIGKSSANGSVPKSGKACSEKVAEKATDDKLAKYVLDLIATRIVVTFIFLYLGTLSPCQRMCRKRSETLATGLILTEKPHHLREQQQHCPQTMKTT